MKSFKSNTLLSFFLFIAVISAFSQPSLFSYEKFINGKDTLKYRQLFPDANPSRKYPLVIFLHGSGERGSDNDAQLKWGVMNFAVEQTMMKYPAFVIAPQCPANLNWANIAMNRNTREVRLEKDPSKPMELVIALINKMIKDSPIDKNRIYITGLSMGGFGTFDAIERYPNLFAAAVPVCGGGDISKVESIKQIPIWIFHGAEDPAVDSQFSLDMTQALTKAGAHPGFTQYPESGHFSWLAAYSDPLTMEWMFRQHK